MEVHPRFELGLTAKDVIRMLNYNSNELTNDIIFLKDHLHVKHTLPASSGRVALYHILKMLNLPNKSKIGVPLYCCTVVFEAIQRAGHIPIFLDIDEETLTVDFTTNREKFDQLDAMIVVHTFGIPADMKKIQEKIQDIPLIEDCAHSPLSKSRNEYCGSFGNAAFFSFGLGKPISTGGGGLIGWNLETESLDINILRFKYKPLYKIIKSWIASYLSHNNLYYTFGRTVRKKASSFTDIGNSTEFIEKYFEACFIGLARYKLESLIMDVETLKKTRLTLQNKLSEGLTITEPKWGEWNSFLFPIRVNSGREKVAFKMFKRGYDCAPMYSNVPSIARNSYGYRGDCPNAEKASKTILTVPHRWVKTEEHAELMAKDIEESMRCQE